jgi:hypothetical protein
VNSILFFSKEKLQKVLGARTVKNIENSQKILKKFYFPAGLNYIWPMGIMMRAMTSNNDSEIMECINMLKISTAGTFFMHESVRKKKKNLHC